MEISPLLADMLAGALQLAGRDWLWPAVILFALALGVVLLSLPSLRRLPPRLRAACISLKLLGFLLLALCLLEPEYLREVKEEQKEAGEHQLALLYDNSLGMQITDRGQAVSRGQALAEAIDGASWHEALAEAFDLREYVFDKRLRRGRASDLAFDGEASNLVRALQAIERRGRGQPPAGLVLFTDGNATDRDLAGRSLAGRSLAGRSLAGRSLAGLDLDALPPIYPVVVGGAVPEPDLSLDRVESTRSAFEEAPISLRADVVAHGCAGREVTAVLTDGEGVELDRKTVVITEDTERQGVHFTHRPVRPGPAAYQLSIESDVEEAHPGNNRRHVVVNRHQGPYRILYVAGRPNWEFKFMHRALQPDEELECAGLIRIARREPKFAFRGRGGESSNPLFRGFNNADEDEGYDQPVLQRLYTRDEEELAGGFPREPAELFQYDALVLDDLEADFFSEDQLDLLEAFVAKRGGGLLMLGGQECYAHGGYEDSALADLLPVYVQLPEGSRPGRELRLDLTREGWLQPWIRLRDTEESEQQRIATMGPFRSLNAVGAIKPGASILATASDAGLRRPALVAHRYGHGRAAALLIADFWRWGFRDPELHDDMERAWRQTLRWLVSDVPRRVSLELTPGPGTITLRAEVRDDAFEPSPEARVRVAITRPSGETLQLEALPSEDEAGAFAVSFKPEEAGAYRAIANVTDEQGEAIGTAARGWALNPAADELREIVPDREWLGQLAEATGGELLELDEATRLPDLLSHPTVTVEITRVVALWHLPWVFLLALACFLAEWWLRRERGLR